MSDELKPCPFCGWKAEIKGPDGDTGGMWEISCPNTCRALVVAERRDWAVRRWNTRPIEDELLEKFQQLQAKWDAIPWEAIEIGRAVLAWGFRHVRHDELAALTKFIDANAPEEEGE